jgi:hypothetical protein
MNAEKGCLAFVKGDLQNKEQVVTVKEYLGHRRCVITGNILRDVWAVESPRLDLRKLVGGAMSTRFCVEDKYLRKICPGSDFSTAAIDRIIKAVL